MAILLSLSNGDDHDENSRFYYNTRMNCQANNYFDIDHFKCRLCDPNFNLVASEQSEFNECVSGAIKISFNPIRRT